MFSLLLADLRYHVALREQDAREMDFRTVV
jgi:hypothetical protein